jgi:hypothetical protein
MFGLQEDHLLFQIQVDFNNDKSFDSFFVGRFFFCFFAVILLVSDWCYVNFIGQNWVGHIAAPVYVHAFIFFVF